MSTRVSELIDAIDRLPAGATVNLEDVTWFEYEDLLDDLGERPGVRVTYDQGKLEIVTISRKHDKYARFIERLISILAEELHKTVESCGSATWKRERDARGTEPDCCFHIASADRVIGRDELDLDVDPPPDLVIEIDVTTPSNKFGIYAAFQVPEVWTYVEKKKSLVMYALRGNSYDEVSASVSFPVVTAAILSDFIESSKTQGQTRALTSFRQWLREPNL